MRLQTLINDWHIWALVLMNVFQLVFWSYVTHRLVDKVMSGSYYNYEQAKALNNQTPVKVSDINVEQFEDLRGVKGIHPFM